MNQIFMMSPSKAECNLATLTHMLGIVLGIIGPLIIWFLKRERPSFSANAAREALNFQITIFIAFIVCMILKSIPFGLLLLPVILIANLVLSIIAALNAAKGKAYRYPVSIRLIR